MAFPTYAVPTGASAPGSAATTFLSAAAGAGLQLQTLPQIAQIQIAVANLLGQNTAVEWPGPITAAGLIKSTTGDTAGFLQQPLTPTQGAFYQAINTGGTLDIGIDNSTGSLFGTAGNYGTAIYRPNSTAFAISRTSTIDLLISSAGAVTLPAYGSGGGAVTTGAADSGGAGFKLLRVPN